MRTDFHCLLVVGKDPRWHTWPILVRRAARLALLPTLRPVTPSGWLSFLPAAQSALGSLSPARTPPGWAAWGPNLVSYCESVSPLLQASLGRLLHPPWSRLHLPEDKIIPAPQSWVEGKRRHCALRVPGTQHTARVAQA